MAHRRNTTAAATRFDKTKPLLVKPFGPAGLKCTTPGSAIEGPIPGKALKAGAEKISDSREQVEDVRILVETDDSLASVQAAEVDAF